MKKLGSVFLALSLIGCADPGTTSELNGAAAYCQQGDHKACSAVPELEARASRERGYNAGQTVLAVGALAIIIPLYVIAAGIGGNGGHHHGHYGGRRWR